MSVCACIITHQHSHQPSHVCVLNSVKHPRPVSISLHLSIINAPANHLADITQAPPLTQSGPRLLTIPCHCATSLQTSPSSECVWLQLYFETYFIDSTFAYEHRCFHCFHTHTHACTHARAHAQYISLFVSPSPSPSTSCCSRAGVTRRMLKTAVKL